MSFLSSCFVEFSSSVRPEIDFLNDVNIFPIDSPSSGRRLGPKMIRAAIIRTITPGAPISRKLKLMVLT